jgi:hypothetical protein
MADTKPVRWRVLLSVLMAAAVIAAFSPAFDVFIAGDDFEWLQTAYDVIKDPLSSLRLDNNFFRPLVKWTYLADYLIFGQHSVGYMVTNLLIHFLNVFLMFTLLRRLLRQPLVAAAAAAAFALSPLHSEGVLWGAGRPDTVLPIFMLGSILLLDLWCESPKAGLAVAFTSVALIGIGAKESWIVFPFIATAYPLLVWRLPIAATFRRMALLWFAWTVYIIVLLVLPALSGAETAAHYADFRVLPALFKTSSTLLAYCGLGFPPFEAWIVVVSAILVIGVTAWLIRTRNGFGVWAMLWLGAMLAVAAPYQVSVLRHNYMPLLGFWMVVASVLDQFLVGARNRMEGSKRKLVVGAVALAAIAVVVIEARSLQLEIADYRLYGELHRRLCQSYAEVEKNIPHDRLLVLVDRGTMSGVEFVAGRVRGTDKTFFMRRDALWQLVFLPPLANFMGRPFDERLVEVEMDEGALESGVFTVLLFEDTGFSLRPDLQDVVAEAVDAAGGMPPGVSLYRFIEQ